MTAQENKPTIETQEKLTAELIPAEGHGNVGYKIFQILDEILKFKNLLGLPAKWNRNYELGKNKHWKNASTKAALVSANLLHVHRQRTVNMLTDNNPTFNIRQVGEVEPEKEEIFDSLLKTAEFWWSDQEQQSVLEGSVINGETYGCTIEKVVFDNTLESGIGEVETNLIDPFHVGWYPVRCMEIQKSEAVLHYWPMSVREARRRWSDAAEILKSDKEYLEELGDERIEVQGGRTKQPKGYFSTFAGIVKNMVNTDGEGAGDSDQVLIVECWVKDFTVDKDGNAKYPGNIRCVQCCNGGKVVLTDRPNPSINPNLDPEQASKTYLWDKFPFSKAQSVTDTSNPWGMSDFEQLEALNIEIDKTISQFTLMKDKTSRLKIINPKDSGVSNSAFTNAPGIINPVSAMVGQGIRYMDPPSIPMDLVNAIEVYKDFFFLVAGTFDMDQAKAPGQQVIAYKAIAALLERAATMLKGKIRNYSKLTRERGRMFLSHVMNWYTEERWISYEQDGDEMTRAIRGTDMIVPAKLNVISGSTMPISRVQEREEALGLFDKGAIDAEALLEKMDWPDRKRVIARLNAGPLGELFSKLEMMGAPAAMIEAFQEIGQMERKDFERELEKGEIPSFPQLLEAPPEEQGPTPAESVELQKVDAEVRKIDADIRKTDAEIALLDEKRTTEKVNQSVSLAGVEFDGEKLAIDRAKAVSEIKAQEKADKEGAGDSTKSAKKTDQGPYHEKGMKSNNKDKGAKK